MAALWRSQQREAERAIANAENYTTWLQAATELDKLDGMDRWRAQDHSEHYDNWLIRSRLQQLRRLRRADDLLGMVHFLRQGMHWNLGGSGNAQLYAAARSGPKQLITDYVEEACSALQTICDSRDKRLSAKAKLEFFQETALSFGRSALMLSGGATLGLFHVGVIKALWDADALPRVISGSSAGSVVAATLGTRSDHELEEMFDAEMAHFAFWRGMGLRSMLRRGALMDQAQVQRGISKHVAPLTFREAYEKTGRIVNITVSSTKTIQTAKLVNYLTFPHLCVRDAVLASCAVPMVFEPVVLYGRDRAGKKVPFMPSTKWVDGSMKSDLPRLRLRRLHNVNHFIVSQTNPHVVPFLHMDGSRSRRGVVNAVRRFAFASAKEQAKLASKMIRDSAGNGMLRKGFDNLHGILEQDYRGNITVVPPLKLRNYMLVAANPSVEQTRQMILEGERATWPKIPMILHQTRISQTFDRCLAVLKGSVQASDKALQREQLKVVGGNGPSAAS